MVDPTGKGSEGEESNPNMGNSNNEHKKTCADCGTTKTPLWRGGPAGPKSLCNACGIRSRKKKRAILGITKATHDDLRKGKRNNAATNNAAAAAFKRDVLLHRSHWKKLGEEERAAVLLMSLSYGSVYA